MYQYGRVVARVITAQGDSTADPDLLPEAVPATGKITFAPLSPDRVVPGLSPEPSPIVVQQTIVGDLDEQGYLSRAGSRGLWLWAGVWQVSLDIPGLSRTTWPIEVTTAHTDTAPLDLWASQPYVPPSGAAVTTMLVPANPVDGYALVWDAAAGGLKWAPAGGGGADATTTTKGVIRLSGDLGGTASAPTVPGLAGKAPLSHTHTLDQTTDTATRLALTPAERTKLAATSGTNTGDQILPTWGTISGKPAVVAAGADQEAARSAISAQAAGAIGGVAVSGTPTAGQVPPATDGVNAIWKTPVKAVPPVLPTYFKSGLWSPNAAMSGDANSLQGMRALPFAPAMSATLNAAAVKVVTASTNSGSTAWIAFYSDSGSFYPGTLLTYGTFAIDSIGVKQAIISLPVTAGEVYWVVLGQALSSAWSYMSIPSQSIPYLPRFAVDDGNSGLGTLGAYDWWDKVSSTPPTTPPVMYNIASSAFWFTLKAV